MDQVRVITWIRHKRIKWIRYKKSMSGSLNINLIIPFKDNKGMRRSAYLREIEDFKDRLEVRAEEMKDELVVRHGAAFELTIAARSMGGAKKFFWRFRSTKKDRKYSRLYDESIVEYLATRDHDEVLRLKEMDEELTYINANLKLLKAMTDSIEICNDEISNLRAFSPSIGTLV